MKRQEATNTFQEGMVMDFNPLTTPNNVVTNCLNGTLITFNGNEYVLQNDMGNGRVETAYLPEGYVPLGTTELGGIIYIVSYNPLIKKCQIGSFPSPERNITTDELGESDKTLNAEEFYSSDDHIKSPYKKLILFDRELHPGDKFQIYCTGLGKGAKNYISAQEANNTNADLYPRYLKFNVVAIQDNGQINNLNDTLVWNTDNDYYIIKDKIEMADGKLDLDEYRGLIQSNYNVFNSKVDGKLAILAQLECIDTFDVAWDAIKDEQGQWNFYFFLNWTYDNDMAKDKINLYSIKVDCDKADSQVLEIEDYPASKQNKTTDILKNQDTVFYTPKYMDKVEDPKYEVNGNIKNPRRNDGTDNQYLLYKAFTVPNGTKGITEFTVYPGMPFGYLDYLKHTFSVDLDKLGTGDIDLKEYRYWHDTGNITLNWALDAYPERNKQIDSVKFNFHKFDKDINDWIKSNGENMDNDRVVETKEGAKWENGASANKISQTPIYTHTVSRQSSYSGHFTENINNLEDNQLYLVEMEINYNKGEKIIRYYRLLYTSNLFNDYYFDVQDNDFKNIVLQEALTKYHPITHTASNLKLTEQDKKTAITDSKGEEVTQIPNTLDMEETQIREYKITNDYQCNVNFDLVSKTDNSLFDISVDNVTIKGEIETDFTSNKQQQVLDSSQSKANSENLDDIEDTSSLEGSFTGNKFAGEFKQTLITPFQVNYQNTGSLPIPYSLNPLDIDCAWLLVDGGSKWIDLYVSNTYTSSKNVDGVYKTGFGDDEHVFGTLVRYTNVYKEIKNRLKGCDVVALRFRVYHTAKSGDEGNWTMWGQGGWSGGDHAGADHRLYYWTKDRDTNGASLLVYAMLDTNDDVQLFTFALKYSSSARWYGQGILPNSDKDDSWPTYWSRPFALTRSQATDEIMKKPFEKYYKITELGDSKSVHTWSRVYYYNNYTWSTQFTAGCTGKMTIKINEEVVQSDAKSPNNLYYTSEQEFQALGHITDKESFDQYLNMLLYSGSRSSLVKRNDGTLLEIENVSPRKIYDKSGNQIIYLKQDKGDTTVALKDQPDTKYKLLCTDEKVRAQISGVQSSDNLMVIGREEEQNIAVSNIIKLTTSTL